MKTTISNSIVALLLFSWMVQGCITPSKEPYQAELDKRAAERVVFDKYESRHTLEGYREFIRKHPESIYVHEANAKIDEILFQPYLKLNTIDGYLEFIRDYPQNVHVDDAKRKIETLAFDHCEEKDTIQAYRQYLKDFPNSNYECEAKSRIHELSFRQLDQHLKANAGFDLLLYRLFIKRLQRKLYTQGMGGIGNFKFDAAIRKADGDVNFITRFLYSEENIPMGIQSGRIADSFFDSVLEKALGFLNQHIPQKDRISRFEFEITSAPIGFCSPGKTVIRYQASMADTVSLFAGQLDKEAFKRKFMVPADPANTE